MCHHGRYKPEPKVAFPTWPAWWFGPQFQRRACFPDRHCSTYVLTQLCLDTDCDAGVATKRTLRRSESDGLLLCLPGSVLRCTCRPVQCTSESPRECCNILQNIASPLLLTANACGTPLEQQSLPIMAFGFSGLEGLKKYPFCLFWRMFVSKESVLKCLMRADHFKDQILLPWNILCDFRNKQTNKSIPARQKSSWADCYHQAGAERSHWYGVIEGFLPLGRITGLEMIARFNRPLKPKGNTSAKRKRPFAPPIDPLLPSSRPLNLHLESATSVSLWAKSPTTPHTEPIAFSYYIRIFRICQSKLCWTWKTFDPSTDWRPRGRTRDLLGYQKAKSETKTETAGFNPAPPLSLPSCPWARHFRRPYTYGS